MSIAPNQASYDIYELVSNMMGEGVKVATYYMDKYQRDCRERTVRSLFRHPS